MLTSLITQKVFTFGIAFWQSKADDLIWQAVEVKNFAEQKQILFLASIIRYCGRVPPLPRRYSHCLRQIADNL